MNGKDLVGLSPDKISEAISRCRNLSEQPDVEVCSRVESELLGKFRSNVSPRGCPSGAQSLGARASLEDCLKGF